MKMPPRKRWYLKEPYPSNLLYALTGDIERMRGIPCENVSEALANGLEEAISMLKEREQIVIHLRYREHKTLKEIAPVLGITHYTVRGIEYRSLKKLRKPELVACYKTKV